VIAHQIIKAKAAECAYEGLVASLASCKLDLGDMCHSRKSFHSIISTMCQSIDEDHQTHLTCPLKSTLMPPHFFLTFDKGSFNRVQNQVLLLCTVITGKRKAIVVSAQEVYSIGSSNNVANITGGRDVDLASDIRASIKKVFPLIDFNFCVGAGADGQYRSAAFKNALFGHDRCSVTWDQSHLLDLVFKVCIQHF